MKICCKCKINQTETSWCKNCTFIYRKQWAEANKEYLKNYNKNWLQSNKELYRKTKSTYYSSIKGRLVDLNRIVRRRAKNKNINFDLSTEFLCSLWEKQKGLCAITKLPLIISKQTNNNKAQPYTPSIDRIDPKSGYLKNNVRLVCYAVNCCLHDFGLEIFHCIANAYINKIINLPKLKPVINEQMTEKQKGEKRYRESLKGTVTSLFNQSKKHAKEIDVNFDISKNDINDLFVKQHYKCCLTNIPFDFKFYQIFSSNPFRPSLDRINSSEGYIKNNIRLVNVAVNYSLNEFGESILDKICTAYLNILLS